MPNKSLENLESALRLDGEVTSEHCHGPILYPLVSHSGDGRTICKHHCVSFISVCCVNVFISVCCIDIFIFGSRPSLN